MINNPGFLLSAFIVSIILLSVIFIPEKGLFARWRRMRRLTRRVQVEDALKHVYHCELRNLPASTQSTAGVLGISVADATELLAQMQAHNLLNFEDASWFLTAGGRDYALQIVRAHRLWERYLADKTGYSEEEWHNQSEQQEHQLTPTEIDKLANTLGNPIYDPHGDPIPTANGEILAPEHISLVTLPTGKLAKIVHLEDEPTEIYRQLVNMDFHLGMLVKIIEKTSGQLKLKTNGIEHNLSTILATNISVIPTQAEEEIAPKASHPLSGLKLGEQARVVGISPASRGIERRRLMDLGIVPGTIIRAEMKSPSGDPTAYLVRGALIALRKEQARTIQVSPYWEVETETLAEAVK